MVEPDRQFMKMAIREARKGLGRTSPNPHVGAVVVKNGRIVGKGYHKKAGTPHAEIHALREAGENASEATIYVTLEPCNHTGRTPPCTRAIVESSIKRVVVGMIDPNPLVAGSGCRFLVEQGLDVVSGILEDECRAMNRPFIKHITTGHPWVIMKAGCSLDGRLAVRSGQSGWITGEKSRHEVHRIRDRVDAILIGIGTALQDDPSLTTRLTARKGHDPLRVVIDSRLRLPTTAKMISQDSNAETWVFCGPQRDERHVDALEKNGVRVWPVTLTPAGQVNLHDVLDVLGREQKNSLLVEGGGRIHGAFLREKLVDQVNLFLAPVFLGADGIALVDKLALNRVQEGPRFKITRTRRFGDDILVDGLFNIAMQKGIKERM